MRGTASAGGYRGRCDRRAQHRERDCIRWGGPTRTKSLCLAAFASSDRRHSPPQGQGCGICACPLGGRPDPILSARTCWTLRRVVQTGEHLSRSDVASCQRSAGNAYFICKAVPNSGKQPADTTLAIRSSRQRPSTICIATARHQNCTPAIILPIVGGLGLRTLARTIQLNRRRREPASASPRPARKARYRIVPEADF